MAQSALTVTTPSPTPPTNMSFTGATGPNPPNYTKVNYAEPFGARDAQGAFLDETPPGVRVNVNPPPYFDDGTAGPLQTFAANTAALAGGTGATSGGTENSYPGTDTAPIDTVNAIGAVPAASSVAHEASGTEVTVLAPGNISHTYPVGTLDMSRSASVGPAAPAPGTLWTPNASHASGAAQALVPTISSVSAGGVSGAGTTLLTVTGTNYTRYSIVYVDGIPQTTNYVSATSLTVANAPKKATAGNRAVTVQQGYGGVITAPTNWVFT